MKTTNKIALALGLLTVAVASQAQTTTTMTTRPTTMARASAGLLGSQYTEVSVGLVDVKRHPNHGYSLTASANTPVVPDKVDAGASYSYSRIRGAQRGHAHTIGGYATAYAPMHGVKPFASAALGYQWTSAPRNGGDQQPVWGAAIGVEIPAGVVTITPRILYSDDFEGSRRSSQAWGVAVDANYWYNATSAVFVSVGRTDVHRSPLDTRNYEIGLRSRF